MRYPTLILSVAAMSALACAASHRKLTAPSVDADPPTTLAEAVDRLQRTPPAEMIQEIRDRPEKEMVHYHFDLGLSIRNSWVRGPLYEYFVRLGLSHPDDISSTILTCLWRSLHGQPLRVEEEVARYKEYWRVNQPPDARSNPACDGEIETTLSMTGKIGNTEVHGVHMGKCCQDGRIWSYQVDRGWYRPTEGELSTWNNREGRYDPCTEQRPRQPPSNMALHLPIPPQRNRSIIETPGACGGPAGQRQGVMRMPTTYPFRLSDDLIGRLPARAADGRCYIDVKVRGVWNGILVVDAHGSCVGIHVRRRVEEFPLPFEPSEIEDVRSPCAWNRALAQFPFSLWTASLLTVFIVSPALLLVSRTLLSPLAGVSTVASLLAVYFMYQSPGFPVIRPLVALAGLGQAIVGALWFVSSVLR